MSASTGSNGPDALWAGVAQALAAPHAATAIAPDRTGRRGSGAAAAPAQAAVRLVREDGLLRWVYEPAEARAVPAPGRRSWRVDALQPRETVQRFTFPELGENEVTAALQRLDQRLNPVLGTLGRPADGLRRWDGRAWVPLPAGCLAGLKGRALVLVHGTFSASAMYEKEFAATPAGRALWARWTQAGGPYAALLAFDHPTLAVSPWLNALALRDALSEALSGSTAELDLLGHSRGGLVIAWLLRMAPALRARRAVFVGSPLAGTSLAAPDKLRQALNTLASLADAVTATAARTGMAAPPGVGALALGVAGLACALGRVLQLGARTPLADAAVGLVPGLLAQGRVANNLELAQLWPLDTRAELHAIGGSFRPTEVDTPLWQLWKRVTHLKDQGLYYGADLVFDQPNDLVVDSASMNAAGERWLTPPHWQDLGPSATTHHCNYFQDERVLGWLGDRLSAPD
ncbi:esterase/lipase family protein [Roseateles sp. BYS87W]|uniref:Esterase/lipase family protein n=1 Tax=Pelomonas baiyunensis TaxID=3299026 RepID=A0ABW7GYU8_9BURK